MTRAGDSDRHYSYRLRSLPFFRRISKKTAFFTVLPLALLVTPGVALAVSLQRGDTDAVQTEASLPDIAKEISGTVESQVKALQRDSSLSASSPPSNNPGGQGSNSTNVTVNGQSIPVPQSGTVRKKLPSGNNNQTNIDITIKNDGSGSTRTDTDISIYSDSRSSSSSREDNGRQPPRR